MLNVVLSCYLFSEVLMYMVFIIWLVDNYLIIPLAAHYKNRYKINKEIDLRNE